MSPHSSPDASSPVPQRILLVHGLWLRAFTLARLAARLRGAGFETETLDYGSVRDEPEATLAALTARLRAQPGAWGVVAHSLGGLIALEALRRAPELPVSRVVCLGSPLRGSRAARALARHRGGRWMLGRSRRLLSEGLGQWDGAAEVGVIAGCLPIGLGFVTGPMPLPHDGTVCGEETRLPGLADHIELRTTHTGLLFSAGAARQAIAFLRGGRFEHAAT